MNIIAPKNNARDNNYETNGISYPGIVSNSQLRSKEIHCHKMDSFDLIENDLLTLTSVNGGDSVLIAAVDLEGKDVISQFGVTDLKPHIVLDSEQKVRIQGVEQQVFDHWFIENGFNEAQIKFYSLFDGDTEAADSIVFKTQSPCQLWVAAPSSKDMITQGGGNTVTVMISSNNHFDAQKSIPSPLAEVRNEFTIPRATAKAYEVKKGEYIQIIDIEGRQCSDFIAFPQSAMQEGKERFIDSTVTRTLAGGAYPQPGLFNKFYDQDMQPLLALVQDTVGRHDTFALACTARGYEAKGFFGHVNCSDNISQAISPYGVKPRAAWPAINLFFNSWITPHDNHLNVDEAWSRPGDFVVMQALADLVCVSTACPDDIDPINGWNPTDIHVRIYSSSAKIDKAIAHRPYPESESIMTENSAFHPRTSELTKSFQVARDLWLPNNFAATQAIEEYWSCRESVTVQDMSSLRKFDIMGPDAQKLLQICMSKNIAKLSVNRGLYSLILSDTGTVIDDGTLFRLSPELFRWCCASDHSGKQLRKIAKEHGLKVWVKSIWSAMPNLAIQGPKSRDLLRKIIFTDEHQPDIDNVKWFGFTIARLFNREGAAMMLTRTGFTGELGYEIFCDHSNALSIWDAVMEAGAEFDIKPMGGEALSMIRIEAGLMVAGAEFTPDVDALEAGLGFAVDLSKEEFVGREALLRNQSAPRRKLVGLVLASNEVPVHGDPIFSGIEQIGIVTSATFSPMLEKPIAMARVAVEYSDEGTTLEVGKLDGMMKRLSANVVPIPFVDPQRERARA